MGYPPVPITHSALLRYTAFLARRLKPQSVSKYLNIIRLLHLESDLPNPLEDNWVLQSLLKGIRRAKGQQVNRKLPITPAILLQLRSHLNFQDPLHTVFWAICLLAFFSLLRKSNILPPSAHGFSPDKHLCRGDFTIQPWGLCVHIRWSKTIQFKERHLTLPLPALPKHPLCPVTAILAALALTPLAKPSEPAFLLPTSPPSPLLYPKFLSTLRSILSSAKIPSDGYSGHSFRRGGATWAFRMLLPTEAIKAMGDWSSEAYMAYLDIPLSSKVAHVQQFSRGLPTSI